MGQQQCYQCQQNDPSAHEIKTLLPSDLLPKPKLSKTDYLSSPMQLPSLPISEPNKRKPLPSYAFPSGVVYEGEWMNNMRDGYGVQVWPDGARYTGYWLQNKAHGQGKFDHVDGDVYDGEVTCTFYISIFINGIFLMCFQWK